MNMSLITTNVKKRTVLALARSQSCYITYPGIGLFSFAKNKQTARVASEFYLNAINVMRGAEAIFPTLSLPLQEAFDIEYWLLEEAKLQRLPKEKLLSRKIALVSVQEEASACRSLKISGGRGCSGLVRYF